MADLINRLKSAEVHKLFLHDQSVNDQMKLLHCIKQQGPKPKEVTHPYFLHLECL